MLSVRDVARKLNCSAGCIYRLVSVGSLPHVRIGVGRGVIRIREEDFDAYVALKRKGQLRSLEYAPPRIDLKSFSPTKT